MVARRYGISLRGFSLISHSFAALIRQRDAEWNTRREIPYLPATMYYFSYFMSIPMTTFLTIFRGFSKFWNIIPKAKRTFPIIIWRLPKTTEEVPKTFQSYTMANKYKCIKGRKKVLSIMISSHVRILISLHAMISYRFYQFDTSRYTTIVWWSNIRKLFLFKQSPLAH